MADQPSRCDILVRWALALLIGLGLACTLLVLSGCAHGASSPSASPSSDLMTSIGGAGGAVFGGLLTLGLSANPALIAAGTLGGLLVGSSVGRLLAVQDRSGLASIAPAAGTAPIGSVTTWGNASQGQQAEVYWGGWELAASGPCRRYEIRTTIEGDAVTITGCAVQRDDGTWELRHGR